MPEKKTIQRAKKDAREGKSASTQAGEFVREEIEHIREGKHGARNPKQAIAIGLSKARRSGVKLPAPKKGKSSASTRKRAKRDLKAGEKGSKRPTSARRSRAVKGALKREGRAAASHEAISKQSKSAAARRKREGQATPSTRRKSTSHRTGTHRRASSSRPRSTRSTSHRRSGTKRSRASH